MHAHVKHLMIYWLFYIQSAIVCLLLAGNCSPGQSFAGFAGFQSSA